ncbi:hypothetical protein [Flavobacterium weaverense]|uniref:Uncharacterized protein n=1 Tax=Flavobacterium weaverense TaxID=271156 RepID=A0A3L9ZRJ6_9FLAO|nr:hypothetical protein [Flavobacterium weaverense]RMA73045.1 hypothetical protein BC961_2642 [Flavobacterium weaverense]
MNKIAKYREQLLCFLENEEEPDIIWDWVEKQPVLDQPDIFRELKTIFKEKNTQTDTKYNYEINDNFDCFIEEFEDSILDEKLAENLYITEIQRVFSDTEKVKEFLTFTRKALINSILTNDGNNEITWVLVHQTIKAEKESGVYDPDNWSAIM